MFNRVKVIPWQEFFKGEEKLQKTRKPLLLSPFSPFLVVKNLPLVSFQLIPNKHTNNENNFMLLKALDELYTVPLNRISLTQKQINYTPLPYFVWEVWFINKKIYFLAHIRSDWREYIEHKLTLAWPKININYMENIPVLPDESRIFNVTLKNHFIFPLGVNRLFNHLETLLETVRIMDNEDKAVLQFIITPLGPSWHSKAEYCYQQIRQGNIPQKIELKTPFYYAAVALEPVMRELLDFTTFLFGDTNSREKDSNHIREKVSFSLYQSVMNKIRQPAFDTTIRIGVYSINTNRIQAISYNIFAFLNLLAGEHNEFKLKPLPAETVKKLNNRNQEFRLNHDILTLMELNKLILLPNLALQNEYKEIEKVSKHEVVLPKILTQGGLLIGHMNYQNVRQEVYLPINNHDELCLPHIVIGGMGTGKTSFGANLAIEAIRNNMGAIIIDPAKGEAGDEIELAVSKNLIKRIKFGQEIVCLDWREALHGERSKNRFANELLNFFEVASDEIGFQTIRYLRAAAKAVPSNRLKDIIELMTNSSYRKKITAKMREQEKEVWENFNTLSDARQNQILHPILNRLDIILGDDYLSECMEAEEGLDFVELLKTPKVIVLDVPKRELGAEAVDVLATLLITKINLAMVLRNTDFPVFVIQDEPHQYMKSYRIWKSAAIESRKWKFSFVWMFHAWEQLPRDLISIIRSANPHYHLYTSSELTYRALAEEIKPFEIQEAINTPTHYAINIIRANNKTLTPFMAKMLPPPSKRKRG